MITTSKPLFVLVLLAAFLLRSNAFAEQMYSYEELLQSPSVRKELDLTDHQIEQLNRLRGKIEMFALQELSKHSFDPSLRGAAEEKQRTEFERAKPEIYRSVYKYQNEVYTRILLEFQMKRLVQIQLRKAGTLALFDPNTQKKLNMTKGQIEQLNSKRMKLVEELRKSKMEALDRTVRDGISRNMVERLWNSIESGPRTLDYALDNLTEDQIEKVDAMKADYEAYVQQRQEGRLSEYDVLTETQRRKLEDMRNEKLETE